MAICFWKRVPILQSDYWNRPYSKVSWNAWYLLSLRRRSGSGSNGGTRLAEIGSVISEGNGFPGFSSHEKGTETMSLDGDGVRSRGLASSLSTLSSVRLASLPRGRELKSIVLLAEAEISFLSAILSGDCYWMGIAVSLWVPNDISSYFLSKRLWFNNSQWSWKGLKHLLL